MDFPDALRHIKAGGRVARRSWIEPGKYIYWVPASTTVTPDGQTVELAGHALFFRPHKGERGLAEPWVPLPDALAATDCSRRHPPDSQQTLGGVPDGAPPAGSSLTEAPIEGMAW